jgi:hypothetical protein
VIIAGLLKRIMAIEYIRNSKVAQSINPKIQIFLLIYVSLKGEFNATDVYSRCTEMAKIG